MRGVAELPNGEGRTRFGHFGYTCSSDVDMADRKHDKSGERHYHLTGTLFSRLVMAGGGRTG